MQELWGAIMFANRAIKSANAATKFANNSHNLCEWIFPENGG